MSNHKGVDKVTVSDDVAALLDQLDEDDEVKRWIYAMKDILLENRMAGEGVQKNIIPRYYLDKYGVDNLYRYRFPKGFRACYTVSCIDEIWYASILEVMTHPEYEDRFGYSWD